MSDYYGLDAGGYDLGPTSFSNLLGLDTGSLVSSGAPAYSAYDYGTSAPVVDLSNSFDSGGHPNYLPAESAYTYAPTQQYNSAMPEWLAPFYSTPLSSYGETGGGAGWGTPVMPEQPSFMDRVSNWWGNKPLDQQIAIGGSMLGGLGNMMQLIQSNKMASQMAKYNKAKMAFDMAQMARMQRQQTIDDRLRNSVDTTTRATVDYHPLTADQLAHYGETGGPQQVYITPGATTRTYLAHGGQADNVHALLSPGEYVFDADTVSALGDGDTQAGAGALDQMREHIRQHKRSAPINDIPPKARDPLAYLPKRGKK